MPFTFKTVSNTALGSHSYENFIVFSRNYKESRLKGSIAPVSNEETDLCVSRPSALDLRFKSMANIRLRREQKCIPVELTTSSVRFHLLMYAPTVKSSL